MSARSNSLHVRERGGQGPIKHGRAVHLRFALVWGLGDFSLLVSDHSHTFAPFSSGPQSYQMQATLPPLKSLWPATCPFTQVAAAWGFSSCFCFSFQNLAQQSLSQEESSFQRGG